LGIGADGFLRRAFCTVIAASDYRAYRISKKYKGGNFSADALPRIEQACRLYRAFPGISPFNGSVVSIGRYRRGRT
jgi:hypothetical protein